MRGRKPKPTRLKIIDGNPGKRPIRGDEPQPPKGQPSCPAHLSPTAKLTRRGGRWHVSTVLNLLDRLGEARCRRAG